MMRRLFIAGCFLAVAGCASQQAANQIATACRSPDGSISSACASQHPAYDSLTPADKKAIAYRLMLNEQVKNNQMTKAQADYLQMEYQDKLVSQNAAQSQAASNAMAQTGATILAIDALNRNNYRAPTTTTCSPFVGSVRCTSY